MKSINLFHVFEKLNWGKLAKVRYTHVAKIGDCDWSSVLDKIGHICMKLSLFVL